MPAPSDWTSLRGLRPPFESSTYGPTRPQGPRGERLDKILGATEKLSS